MIGGSGSATIPAVVASMAARTSRSFSRCTAIGGQRLHRKLSSFWRGSGATRSKGRGIVTVTVTAVDPEGMTGTRGNTKKNYSTATATATAIPQVRTLGSGSGNGNGHPMRSIRNATRLRWCSGSPTTNNYTTTTDSETNTNSNTPLDVEALQSHLVSIVPGMARGLSEDGYYTTADLLPESTIRTLRDQSVALRFKHGRFEQSYSETIDATTGNVKERFDKEGVYACEPDGRDYYDATDLVTYMSVFLQTLPEALNLRWEWESQQQQQQQQQQKSPSSAPHTGSPLLPALSSESFNAKLAVTEHGGAKYPLHVDNPQGLAVGDTRKLTCILYLNPDHVEDDERGEGGDGGAIRLYLPSSESTTTNAEPSGGGDNDNDNDQIRTVDLSPIGGRLLVFWSDEIPHEVLPTSTTTSTTSTSPNTKDRYALTIWIPTSNVVSLHNESSKFGRLKDLVFARNQQ